MNRYIIMTGFGVSHSVLFNVSMLSIWPNVKAWHCMSQTMRYIGLKWSKHCKHTQVLFPKFQVWYCLDNCPHWWYTLLRTWISIYFSQLLQNNEESRDFLGQLSNNCKTESMGSGHLWSAWTMQLPLASAALHFIWRVLAVMFKGRKLGMNAFEWVSFSGVPEKMQNNKMLCSLKLMLTKLM